MSKLVRDHVRSNVVGYLALFLVLTMGTAYATHPGGANTISTQDIINGQVRAADIGSNQVLSADVRDDTIADGRPRGSRPGAGIGRELGADDERGPRRRDRQRRARPTLAERLGRRRTSSKRDSVRASEILRRAASAARTSRASALGARACGLRQRQRGARYGRRTSTRSANPSHRHLLHRSRRRDRRYDLGRCSLTPDANSDGTGTGSSSVVDSTPRWAAPAAVPRRRSRSAPYLHDGDQLDDDDGGGNATGDTTPLNARAFAFMIP